jgi:hypothetical protein
MERTMKAPMHIHRRDLVRLVSEGTPMDEMLQYFTVRWKLSFGETFHLFRDADLMTPLPKFDNITETRRKELQDLSLS